MPVSLTIRRILSVYPVDLPVFHPIAIKLQQLLATDFTIDEIISVASQDQVLAAKILRIANSPAYRGSEAVETIKDAVVRLGAQPVANIAMAASQASLHVSDNEVINRTMRKLWQHSHACALGCRWLSLSVGLRRMADQAYLAGLLHDIGKLYLLKAIEKLNKAGVARAALEDSTLREVFKELHVEEGSKLMEHWHMPRLYRTVVERHHDEECNVENLVLIIVRLVNSVCRKMRIGLQPDQAQEAVQHKEMSLLGVGNAQMAGLEALLDEARAMVL